MATYANLSQQAYQIIQEAFERIGIPGEMMEEQKFDGAIRSLNFLFQELAATDTSLWSLRTGFIGLNAGQSDYVLSQYLGGDNFVKTVDQAFVRTSQRQLQGEVNTTSITGGAAVAGHDIDQAFTSTTGNYCQYTYDNISLELNVNFTYTFDVATMINFVGIQGYTNPNQLAGDINQFSLILQGDGNPLLNVQNKSFYQDIYGKNIIYWYPVISPNSYVNYQFSVTGTNVNNVFQTVAFSNIFLCNQINDTQISPIARSDYLAIPNKLQQSRPSSYYFDRQSDLVLSLWPAPSSQYNCLMISYEQMVQDVSTAVDTLASPTLYNEAIIWGLAYRMACKYAPDKISFTKQMADQTFMTISNNFSETTPLRVLPDWTNR